MCWRMRQQPLTNARRVWYNVFSLPVRDGNTHDSFTPNGVPNYPYQTNYTKIGYNPIVREEFIRGEDAIRQAIQHWR